MDLASGELIKAICMPRRYSEYVHYSRKVGARNAQAISKVCIAALASMEGDTMGDIRIALGSVAPIPLRLFETESLLNGKPLDESAIVTARKSVQQEIAPIDDIRSSAQYRAAVTANLLEEFLRSLLVKKENLALARWNRLPAAEAEGEILTCCGSRSWADSMTARRPFTSLAELIATANEVWRELGEPDWLEAFRSHPQIGELHAEQKQSARSAQWSAGEQGGTASAEETVKLALAEGNREYERRFGHIFIVCASGKSAAEMLDILRRRLHNDAQAELREAAEQQRQITELRLRKWLAEKA
jgi:2-oxo-4-hydroxy-4-carboxy-5-ureidoimidazoline decarboxylase